MQSTSAAESLQFTHKQRAELMYRGHAHILSAGGRGSGKSTNLINALLLHVNEFGGDARPLVVREGWQDLVELQSKIYGLLLRAFPGANRNKNEGVIELPTGAVIYFSNISDMESYSKLQGRNLTGIFADEAGNYSPQSFAFLQRLRSNLRVPAGRRAELFFSANPHGRCHSVLYKHYVSKAPPWKTFQDEAGEWWVWTHSTLMDNSFIDQEQYRRQLVASTGGDTALADAWINGSWSVLGGSMFDVFDPALHIVRDVPACNYSYRVGIDWGTAAPCVALLVGRVPSDVHGYAPGSIVVLDERDTASDENDLSVGNGAPLQAVAEMVKEMCGANGNRVPRCVVDDARGLGGETVVGELRKLQLVAYRPTRKDRVGGWILLRQLLSNTKTGDGPGLYISSRARHLIETLPEAPRGTLRPEDVDPKWNKDHWLDALAYAVMDVHLNRVMSGTTTGHF